LLQVTMGVMAGGWGARVPEIRAAVGADDRTWGLVSAAPAVGDVLALSIVFFLIGRVNTRRLALVGAVLILINAPLAAAAPSLTLLVAGYAAWIFGASMMATPMGGLQLEVQRQYGRSLMGSFIACWSLGSFAGAGLGTLAAAVSVAPGLQFAICSVILGALLLFCGRWLPDETIPARTAGARPRILDRFTGPLLLLALMSFLAGIINNGPSTWSASYTKSLGAGAATAAATYTAAAITSAVGQLVVDRPLSRFGPVPVLLVSMAVGVSGMVLALAVGTPAASIVGFALVGLGMSCTGPIINGRADRQSQVSASEAVSMVEMGYLPGNYLSPVIIGLLAGVTGLREALVVVIVALVA
ncbi:MAG: MFS transporter, partial [Trebonia sp.]